MTEVVRIHHDRVVAYLRFCTGNLEIAEEIAQEAFLKLYRDRERIHGPDKILPWMMVTSRRMAIKEMKRMRYRSEISLPEGSLNGLAPIYEGNQVDHVKLEELNQLLGEEMQHLKPQDREIIALRFISGLQIKEISDVMSIPMGSVGVFLRRSLDKLRHRLEQRGIRYEDL